MTDHAPTPGAEAAVKFLQVFSPEGPWCLTAFALKQPTYLDPEPILDYLRPIDTKTFYPPEIEECRRWIDAHNGQSNLSFSVNPVIGKIEREVTAENIASVKWLHVELVHWAGEDLEEERERMLRRLTDKLPEGVPAPTVVVDDGVGYCGFWRLREPVPINGDTRVARYVELYIWQLELLYHAEFWRDIARMARLPGIVNLPNANRRDRGYLPTVVSVVKFAPERTYSLAEFMPVPGEHCPPVTTSGGLVKFNDGMLTRSEIEARANMQPPYPGEPDPALSLKEALERIQNSKTIVRRRRARGSELRFAPYADRSTISESAVDSWIETERKAREEPKKKEDSDDD